MRRMTKSAALALILGVAVAGGAAEAQQQQQPSSLADLVIVENESSIRFVSCQREQPLIEARIVIKNIGGSVEKVVNRGGVAGVAGALVTEKVRVYLPLARDFAASENASTLLKPFEADVLEFSIGQNLEKRGVLFSIDQYPPARLVDEDGTVTGGSAPLPPIGGGAGGIGGGYYPPSGGIGGYSVDIQRLSYSEVVDIQRALQAVGLYHSGVDGVYGRFTRYAMRRFANDIGAAHPYRYLSRRLLRRLEDRSGVSLDIVGRRRPGDDSCGYTPPNEPYGCDSGDYRPRYDVDLSGVRPGDVLPSGSGRRFGELRRRGGRFDDRYGDRSQYSQTRPSPSSSFEVDVFVEVDPQQRIAESNELNNLSNFRIRVTNCGLAPDPAPTPNPN